MKIDYFLLYKLGMLYIFLKEKKIKNCNIKNKTKIQRKPNVNIVKRKPTKNLSLEYFVYKCEKQT